MRRVPKYYVHRTGKRLVLGDAHHELPFACLPKELATSRPMVNGRPMPLRHPLHLISVILKKGELAIAQWEDVWGRIQRRYIEAPKGRGFWLLGPAVVD